MAVTSVIASQDLTDAPFSLDVPIANGQVGQILIRVDPETAAETITQSPSNGGLQEDVKVYHVDTSDDKYTTLIEGFNMMGKANFVWYPPQPLYGSTNSVLRVQIANEYKMGTVYVSVFYRDV